MILGEKDIAQSKVNTGTRSRPLIKDFTELLNEKLGIKLKYS